MREIPEPQKMPEIPEPLKMLGIVEQMLSATGVDTIDTFEDGAEVRTRLSGRTLAVPFVPEDLLDEVQEVREEREV